jgi:ABC-2 type transport system permease protein
MSRVWAIFVNDLHIFFAARLRFVVTVVIVPAMVTLLGGIAIPGWGTQTLRVDVIDRDAGTLSRQLLADLQRANPHITLCPAADDAQDLCALRNTPPLDTARAQERLQRRVTQAFIEIPGGFGARFEAGQPATLAYQSGAAPGAPDYVFQALQASVQHLSGAMLAARAGRQIADEIKAIQFVDDADRQSFIQKVYDRAAALWAQEPLKVSYTLTGQDNVSTNPSGFGQSVPGMASLFVMYTVFGSMMAVIAQRRNWTLPRLASMPVSPAGLLAGKILAWFTIGLMQFSVIFAAGLLTGLNFGHDLLALVLLMVAYTLCVTALAFCAISFLKTERQVLAAAVLLTFTLAPLGGAWWPLEVVPTWMQTVGHLSPIAWVMDGFHSLMYYGGSLASIVTPLVVLLALGGLLFAVAARRFRAVDFD